MQMKIHNLSSLPVLDYRSVVPLQGNLKDLDETNHDKLLRVLTKRGFTTPLFLWRNPEDAVLYLLDGHQRQRVMIANDMNDDGNYGVPYALIPGDTLKDAKEQLLEITSQYGHITMEGLDEFAFDLDLENLNVHFDALDLDKFLDAQADDEVEEDEPPEVDEINPPVSVLGEVYQLGRHRLMCGDATDPDAVDNLLDGTKPDLLFTDPPYGLGDKWSGGTWATNPMYADAKKWDAQVIPWDHMQLIIGYASKAVVWGGNYYPMPPSRCWLSWIKSNQMETMADFELAWTNIDAPAKSYTAARNADGQRDHPTQKPVGLMAWGIKRYSNDGDVVLDVFGGSGSTLIACEQLDRTCCMMELDPKYCDVIRKRYAKLVGAESWEAATTVSEVAKPAKAGKVK